MKRILIILLLPMTVLAADAEYTIVIKEHRFNPSELKIPSGKKIKLLIENQDSTPEEFESHALNREKIISGNGKTSIYIGPLEAGSYSFVGEFHDETAHGVIIAQ